MSKKVRRLFAGFVPRHYQLFIDPDRDQMTINGTVTITGVKQGRPSQRLTFHQHGLTVTHATVTKKDKKGDREISVSRINHQRSFDEVRLHADELLYPGEYTVTLTFKGTITPNMDGIYPSFFKHDGKDKTLITTQFESHHAREAFPCIDEPEAKAVFDLTLVSPVGETVIANTPVARQEAKDGRLVTSFAPTPKMSTYLLAFMYGELGYTEATTKDGVVIRAYATPDNVEHTAFALETAVKVLEAYNEYFAIPYPLPKCDLVAVPDFAAGAMENWGLITFREHTLLVDPANTSLASKQFVAAVVAHELAHQWFGNLVTMRWWTDLWLNEGFANFMEYYIPGKLFPEWQMSTQYVVDEQQPGLASDALENTHPVEVAISHPDEIRTIFDNISYNKGGSSILMLVNYLGEETFRDGLRHYLKQHAYGNTDTIDLWEALETVSKKPVKQFMAAWIGQPGFPLVSATVGNDQVTLTQEPFRVNPLRRDHHGDLRWPVPLNAGPLLPDVFEEASVTLKVDDPSLLKLNQGQSGFYRTVYDAAHLQRLAARVQAGALLPLDRLGILSDATEAAMAGYTDTLSALELLAAYAQEDNAAVWDIIATFLTSIRIVMNDETTRDAMRPYVRRLVAGQVARLGWEPRKGESHFDSLLRPTVLGLAAMADDPEVTKVALDQFAAMQRPEDILPELRGLVYGTAARLGSAETFERLFAMHQATISSEEKMSLSAALTNFHQPELIERSLGFLTDRSIVRPQDLSFWIGYSFLNRHSRTKTWEWLKGHWEWLRETLGGDLAFYRLPIYAARTGNDYAFLDDYKQFFTAVMQPAIERSFRQGVEMIEWHAEWRRRDLEAIRRFFEDRP